LLRENYAYGDGKDTRIVPLAAFASPVHDSRTSCISVIQSEKLLQVASEDVYQFKGLGAPVVFVPHQEGLQWWTIRPEKAEYLHTIAKSEIDSFFEKHSEKFAPESIWRAKNIGRVTGQQLSFVDIGLMKWGNVLAD
jgi:hypothetical protein